MRQLVTAAGLGLAIVLGALTEPVVLLLAVALAQGVVVAGWYASLAVPGTFGGAVVAGGTALGADLVVLAEDGDRPLSSVPAVLAVSVLAALVHQLVRRDGRDRLTASPTHEAVEFRPLVRYRLVGGYLADAITSTPGGLL